MGGALVGKDNCWPHTAKKKKNVLCATDWYYLKV